MPPATGQKIRVLHVIDLPGPGGAETVFATLATRLDQARFSSIGAVPSRSWTYDRLMALGVPVHITPVRQRPFDVGYLVNLVRIIRSERVDVVQTHLLGPAVYGSLAGLICRTPVVATFHGYVDVAASERFLRIKCGIINRAAARVVFVSSALRAGLLSRFPVASRLAQVIPNGIEDAPPTGQPRETIRAAWGVGDGDLLVGAIGHLRAPKGYEVLLRTAAALVATSDKYRFVIVGQTERVEYLDSLMRLRADLGMERHVSFVGPRDDIGDVLGAFDIYVLSSLSEGFSLSTVQAMRAGIPVVATRSGGPETLLEDGVTGVLATPGDPAALAEAIGRLGGNAVERRTIGDAGQAAVALRYRVEDMVEAYQQAYLAARSS